MGINRQESINNHFYILVCYNNENQAVNEDVPVPGDESEDVIDDEDVIDEEDDIDEEDVVDDEDVVDEEEDVIDDVIDKEVAEEN